MADEVWCRLAVLGPDGAERAAWVLHGPGSPDLSVIDALARLQLVAARTGGGVVLADLCPALRELLDLAGLQSQLKLRQASLPGGTGREVGG